MPSRMIFKILLIILLAMVLVRPVFAVNPDEVLPDAKLEERARDLSAIIRCMKCQNQSIDDSDADLARDLRVLVRERLVEGDSDQQVLDYLVDRYGEFVLLKPQFSISNALLWGIPLLALFSALFLSWRMIGKKQEDQPEAPGAAKLSEKENKELTKILGERD